MYKLYRSTKFVRVQLAPPKDMPKYSHIWFSFDIMEDKLTPEFESQENLSKLWTRLLNNESPQVPISNIEVM